jgi:tRNA threonylcarbamoyladenosine biosynthesis protein TsaE
MKWRQIESTSENMTSQVGHDLAALLHPGCVVALYGDLGAGKTVFSRGMARGLGITEPVTSPTFTVVQEYPRPHGGWFFHLDMYRIDHEEAALAFGIEEYLFVPDGITVVEWPERIEGLLESDGRTYRRDNDLVVVRLTHAGEGRRHLCLPVTYAEQLTC